MCFKVHEEIYNYTARWISKLQEKQKNKAICKQGAHCFPFLLYWTLLKVGRRGFNLNDNEPSPFSLLSFSKSLADVRMKPVISLEEMRKRMKKKDKWLSGVLKVRAVINSLKVCWDFLFFLFLSWKLMADRIGWFVQLTREEAVRLNLTMCLTLDIAKYFYFQTKCISHFF